MVEAGSQDPESDGPEPTEEGSEAPKGEEAAKEREGDGRNWPITTRGWFNRRPPNRKG